MTDRDERPDLWTATEFLTSIEPHRMGQAGMGAADEDALVRRADAVAVMQGLGWNKDGEYPIAVWIKAYKDF